MCLFEGFYMYMGAHTQINAAVFITVWGALDIHTLICVYIQGPSPANSLTHPGGPQKCQQVFSSNTCKHATGQTPQICD